MTRDQASLANLQLAVVFIVVRIAPSGAPTYNVCTTAKTAELLVKHEGYIHCGPYVRAPEFVG